MTSGCAAAIIAGTATVGSTCRVSTDGGGGSKYANRFRTGRTTTARAAARSWSAGVSPAGAAAFCAIGTAAVQPAGTPAFRFGCHMVLAAPHNVPARKATSIANRVTSIATRRAGAKLLLQRCVREGADHCRLDVPDVARVLGDGAVGGELSHPRDVAQRLERPAAAVEVGLVHAALRVDVRFEVGKVHVLVARAGQLRHDGAEDLLVAAREMPGADGVDDPPHRAIGPIPLRAVPR